MHASTSIARLDCFADHGLWSPWSGSLRSTVWLDHRFSPIRLAIQRLCNWPSGLKCTLLYICAWFDGVSSVTRALQAGDWKYGTHHAFPQVVVSMEEQQASAAVEQRKAHVFSFVTPVDIYNLAHTVHSLNNNICPSKAHSLPSSP